MSWFSINISSSSLTKRQVNISKLAHLDPENLIKIDQEVETKQLPTYLFEDIEGELTSPLFLDTGNSEEETDGASDFIKNIVDKIKKDIEKANLNGDLTKFIHTLTKIFTLLLNIKVDTGEKIIKIVKLLNSLIVKKWSEQN